MQIMDNFEKFGGVIEDCMNQAFTSKSFKDPQHPSTEDFGCQLMASLSDVLFEYVITSTVLVLIALNYHIL
jgi:hypothetical protein